MSSHPFHGHSLRELVGRANDSVTLETLVNAVDRARFEGLELSPSTERKFVKAVEAKRRAWLRGDQAQGGRDEWCSCNETHTCEGHRA